MNQTWRIWRSPRSDFSATPANELEEESCRAYHIYDDAELVGIAQNGFNAVWVHAILHHLVSVEPFPELGKQCGIHRRALEILIFRAAKHGIRVFLYLQVPRAIPMNDDFWLNHADCGGTLYESYGVRSLCVSAEPVREWMRNASAELARSLPELGGLILITASELPAHCYSHRNKQEEAYRIKCPRCREREPQDIVADILNAVRDGVRKVDAAMPIIVWNWSWTTWGLKSPWREIVERLPSDLILMADFERGGKKDFWKRPSCEINEYCLSYAGPSDACRNVMSLARSRGMKIMAKLQFGTTHELASVVSLPLMNHIFRKALFMKNISSDGYLGCWIFGNFFSANTAGFNFFLREDVPSDEWDALKRFAAEYFPGCDSKMVLSAWTKFSEVMFYYPFTNPFIYRGPMNYTLVYREIFIPEFLKGTSSGPSHLPTERGDDLAPSIELDGFTAEDIDARMEKLYDAWADSLAALRRGLASSICDHAEKEYGNAVICGSIWKSTANTYRIYELRKNWSFSLMPEFRRIARDEIRNLNDALPWVAADERQGWHAEAHAYLFDKNGIQEKIKHLECLVSES